MRRLSLFVLVALAAVSADAVQPILPRFPAPSPDGRRVAFSWQGDLWIAPSEGGPARRLTANPGYDSRPAWFADGARLAFSSDREGDDDVFVLTVGGGAPRRLTFHESADLVQGVAGERVIFTSRRHEAWDRMPAVYAIPVTGGTEGLAAQVLALEAVPSPDGRFLALVRGGTPADRRHYRGSANRDIWLLDLTTRRLERLTTTAWDEDGVCWAGDDALVYRSDGGGEDRNLYRLDLAERTPVALTHLTGADVRNPATSLDGRRVAFEWWDGIYAMPTDGSGEPRRLAIDVPDDEVEPAAQRGISRADAEEIVASPDGSQVALVVKGDVYVVERRATDIASVAEAPTVRVTDTPARERGLAWSPDGTRLYYTSDRSGDEELYFARPTGVAEARFYRAVSFAETQLAALGRGVHGVVPSPDGSMIAFVHDKGDLMVASSDGSDPRCLFRHWGEVSYSWSPDSKWLGVSREDQSHNSDVWVVAAAGGAAVNVSQHPQDDVSPIWSPDGRRLYWLSKRHASTVDIWYVYLTQTDHERTVEEWIQLFEDERGGKDREREPRKPGSTAKAERATGDEGGTKADVRPVVIDFERISQRARPLTELPGDEGEIAVSPDGKTIVFVAAPEGERDIYKVRWDGKELSRLTSGGTEPRQVAFANGGKSVFYRSGKGTVGNVIVETGKSGDPTPFAARYAIERSALLAQVFDEAWRELDRWFYDPEFHGHDWQALRKRYRGLALAASSRRDFDDVVNLMLGELNASHMGFRPPAARNRPRTGELGIEVAPVTAGPGVVITEVLPDTPGARVSAGLKAGDRIVAVDGEELHGGDNFFARLIDATDAPVRLRVVSGAAERDVTVIAGRTDEGKEARYRLWTRQRRALVDRLSGGRLGYIHIQGMSMPSLEDFERDLYAAAHDKEGLLIDVRNNGGGWTTDYLMAILEVRRHAWTVPRDADTKVRAYPQDRLPLPAWTRPAAALCDEASYSNAEIFSWAFKTLERGPLVGMPTFGAVISTGGARLADGSFVRLPSRGWFVAGSGINMEHHGCPPDVVVEQPPDEDLSAEHDAQLEKAVEVLLSTLPEPAQLPW